MVAVEGNHILHIPTILFVIFTNIFLKQRVLRLFGHVERMDEYHIARNVLMAEVSGGRVRRRPRLGWMDGVKVALVNREMTVEAARQCGIGKSEEPWCICNWMSFTLPFCFAQCSFGPPSRVLVVITWRGVGCRYTMRVEINCIKGELLKIKAQASIWTIYGVGKYMEYFDDRVCVIWLNMTTPPWWREKVMVYYLKIILFKIIFNVK